ncbi:MAG: hypothetical protein SF162_10445 [bacterium]|nr:hypothetical protein [bacterium]
MFILRLMILFGAACGLIAAPRIDRVLAQPAAQITPLECPIFVAEALERAGDVCSALDRNSACYGNLRLTAAFNPEQTPDYFTRPADRSPLNLFTSIRTAPLSRAQDEWGIGLISAQASLPGALPGQNAVFLLVGDASIENAVPDDALMPDTARTIPVTLTDNAEARFLPSFDSSVTTTFVPGVPLLADAVSLDGAWARVTLDDALNPAYGWIEARWIANPADLLALPAIDPAAMFTPMQAFVLRTTVGRIECQEAPNTLVVQGPERLQVQIQANGADIRLGSTILLDVIPVAPDVLARLQALYRFSGTLGGLLRIIVLDGEAILFPGTPFERVVPAGYQSVTCLGLPDDFGTEGDPDDFIIVPGCGFTDAEPIPPDVLAQYAALDGVTLNYPIRLPDAIEVTPTPTATPTRTPNIGGLVLVTNTPASTLTPLPTLTPVSTFTPTAVPPTAVPPTAVPPSPTPTVTPPCSPLTFPITIPDGDTVLLADAIRAANNEVCFPATQQINLATESIYTFATAAADGFLNGDSALPVITSSINLNMPTASLSSGAPGGFRLFSIAPGGVLSIFGSGSISDFYDTGNDGGAILNEGTLSLGGIELRNNGNASVPHGGAVKNTGNAIIGNTYFNANSAGSDGGAVANYGILGITKTTFENNSAGTAGAIAHNSGTLIMLNSTVSGNTATGNTGGIVSASAATLSFVTLADNTGTGGSSLNGSFIVKNSLVDGGTSPACAGAIDGTLGGNWSNDAACGFGTYTGTALNASTTLGPFPTRPLNGIDPPVDAVVDCTDALGVAVTDDQNGQSRPRDGDLSESEECDPGAVEIGF